MSHPNEIPLKKNNEEEGRAKMNSLIDDDNLDSKLDSDFENLSLDATKIAGNSQLLCSQNNSQNITKKLFNIFLIIANLYSNTKIFHGSA